MKILASILLASLLIAGAADPKPNIIFVMADDMGYGDLGCYGQKVIQTPFIDQMAKEGTRFTQVYAGAPVCAPAFPDCVETVVQDDEAGDAIDSDGDGATSGSVCAPPPGFPDYCVDTIVHGDDTGDVDDNGEGSVTSAPLCAPDFPDCADMIVVGGDGYDDAQPVTDPRCSGDQFASCEEQPIAAAR